MDKKLLQDYSWIIRGSQRLAVIKVMDKIMTPSQIQKEAKKINPNISLNNCSDVLRAMEEHGIVKCLNPKEKLGRLYELSKKGKEIQKELLITSKDL